MRLDVSWLEEFVDRPDTDALAAQLAAAGIEVEAIEDARTRCTGVVVARVVSVAPHPQAERLRVCVVDDGTATHQVVCGAPRVEAQMRVAYAPVGARLGEMELSARNLRGVQSAGMLCSREELGMCPDGDGLLLLADDAPIGADLALHLKLPTVFELGITPNRGDLLGHLGLAREVAAAGHRRLRPAKWRLIEKGPEVSTLARALVDEPQGCRRFVGRVLQNVSVGPSPLWLRERLAAMGQRSVNNVVDVTNYVMFELNQPLHAYDLSRLAPHQGLPTLRVRRAEAGETLTTLDGTERKLDPADLVVADGARPVALAGVMGGRDSEVVPETTQLLLEGACFDASWVRRSARRHGLRTEASYRFERGSDVAAVARAVDRCAQLLGEVAGASAAKGALDVQVRSDGPLELTLRCERVARLLGLKLAPEQLVALLEPLEIRCVRRTESALVFVVPTFRSDITREVDLVEEVARRFGYSELPERLPQPASGDAFAAPAERTGERARRALLAAGLSECVTFAFAAEAEQVPFAPDGVLPVRLRNPLGEQHSVLRTTLMAALVRVLQHNQRHGQKGGAYFELGQVFSRAADDDAGRDPQAPRLAPPAPGDDLRVWMASCDAVLPREATQVAVLLAGPRHAGRWYEGGDNYAMADLKGVLEALLEAYDVEGEVDFAPCARPALNPYASATVRLDTGDGPREVGVLGQLEPGLQAQLGLSGDIFVAELQVAPFEVAVPRARAAVSLPKYPGTRRDVALVAPPGVSAEAVRRFLAEHAGGRLGTTVVNEVRLFDVYRGAPLAEGEVSLAFAITYQDRARTLTDAEVNEAFHAALTAATDALGVTVRDGTPA